MRQTHLWNWRRLAVLTVVLPVGLTSTQLAWAQTAPRPDALPRPAATEVDADSGMSFALFKEGDEMVVRGELDDLRIEKRNGAGGTMSFSVETGEDVVTVRIAQRVLTVGRSGRETRVDVSDGRWPSDMTAVESMLDGSPALAAVDRLVARLGARLQRPALVESLRQVHAWSSRLRGQAVPAQAWVAGLSAPGAGPVRTGTGAQSCWLSYEREIWAAYSEFSGCYISSFYLMFGAEMVRDSCGILYYLRAESAWFELLSCVAFPW